MVDFEIYRRPTGSLDIASMMIDNTPPGVSDEQLEAAVKFTNGVEALYPIRSRQVAALTFATAIMISGL